jgi:DNA-binding response OmpR family regulator
MTAPHDLAGRRILVVEDDWLIAVSIEEALHKLGCTVVGPVSKLDRALELAKSEVFDAAILDITIRGGQVFPVAESLRSRGIPFVFASGYGDWALPASFQGQARLTKPFTADELQTEMQALCRENAGLDGDRSPA